MGCKQQSGAMTRDLIFGGPSLSLSSSVTFALISHALCSPGTAHLPTLLLGKAFLLAYFLQLPSSTPHSLVSSSSSSVISPLSFLLRDLIQQFQGSPGSSIGPFASLSTLRPSGASPGLTALISRRDCFLPHVPLGLAFWELWVSVFK